MVFLMELEGNLFLQTQSSSVFFLSCASGCVCCARGLRSILIFPYSNVELVFMSAESLCFRRCLCVCVYLR